MITRKYGSAESRAVNAVNAHVGLIDLLRALEPFADLFGHADRCEVVPVDDADDVVGIHVLPRPRERGLGGLGRKAVAPTRVANHPAELESGPSFRIPETDTAHDAARRFFDHRPLAVAAQLPMADHDRDTAPRAGDAAARRVA